MNPYRTKAFSLVELLVVLVLLALIGSASLVMVRYPLAQVRRELAVTQLSELDAFARDRSRNGERMVVRIDCGRQFVELIDSRGQSLASFDPELVNVKLEGIVTQGYGGQPQSTVEIEYTDMGVCTSFAVRMKGLRSGEDWLIFLGLSGQVVRGGQDRVHSMLR
jgi:prepilin-type N-terminal cleavage/methylation domain-containing protein